MANDESEKTFLFKIIYKYMYIYIYIYIYIYDEQVQNRLYR